MWGFVATVGMMAVLVSATSAREGCSVTVPLQDRVRRTPVVFHGLAVRADPAPQGLQYSAQFWLIKVYKGSRALVQYFHLDPTQQEALDIRDRRVNVTGFLRPEGAATPDCWPILASQKYFVVMADVVGQQLVAREDAAGALVDWSAPTEEEVWRGVGWGQWTDWAACSASCGEGSQYRLRYCLLQEGCEGFNKETRRCNMFSCQGVVTPLLADQKRYLHGQWGRAPDRLTAWRLRPSAYLWLPAAELPTSVHHLRKHFALLVTLRLNPKEPAAGTLFSLRSRRQQNAYLSVELAGKEAVKLVHAGANGTQTVLIPASLADGHWHQLAIGVQQDSSVRSYLDCHWISTDILRRDSLDIPEDADVVIGYLFSGDLEQLVMVADPAAVNQQCSTSQQPSLDPSALHPIGGQQKHRRTESKDVWYSKKENEIWQDDEDLFEGSGSNLSLEQHEYAWSEWSKCSVTCGLGVQTRHVSCSDSGLWMGFCLESSQGKTETRQCSATPCSPEPSNLTGTEGKDLCECHNGGTCHLKRRTCHCPAGFQGRHCEIRACPGPCLHGGICHNSGHCSCPPEYTGETCQIPVCRPPCMNGGQCVKPGVCSCPSHSNHPRCATMCPGGCEPGGACVSPGVCRCLPGFHGSLCQDSLCPQGCYNGGQCLAANQCNCTTGWTGPDCSTPVCEPGCQRGGRCVGPQKCLCPVATHGPTCQNYTCIRGCYNGGLCVGPDLCECPANSTGPTCAQPLCDPPCENGAACGPGNTCLCAPHTTGTRCQTRNCDYRFVQEPYTKGFRKLVKKRVETKCGANTCFRTVAEYQTVYKTFYRTVYKCAGD